MCKSESRAYIYAHGGNERLPDQKVSPEHYDTFDPFLCHLNEELEFDDKME